VNSLYENNLQIIVPKECRIVKFDDKTTHGLSHCMKAVDFIIVENDRILFIEFKDPEHPNAKATSTQKWMNEFSSGELFPILSRKYRDSFLYEWASGNINNGLPIFYLVLLCISDLDDAALSTASEILRRNLPLDHPVHGKWGKKFAKDCFVLNLNAWNKQFPQYPVNRI